MNKTYNKLKTDLPVNINSREIQNNEHPIDFYYEHSQGRTLLYVTSNLLERDNYQISVNGKSLLIIIWEQKEISEPMHIHHFGKNISKSTKYERLRSKNISLPSKNYYVKNTYVDLNNHQLIIELEKSPLLTNNSKTVIVNF